MKKIILINSGPLKLNLVTKVFAQKFPDQEFEITPFDMPSKGSDILSKENCLKILRNAVDQAQQEHPDANYYIMMRGRFEETPTCMEECALVLVRNKENIESYSQAVSFEVPEKLAVLVRDGVNWSKAIEQTYDLSGVKEGSGFCGYLTGGLVTKGDQYFHALVVALSGVVLKQNEETGAQPSCS